MFVCSTSFYHPVVAATQATIHTPLTRLSETTRCSHVVKANPYYTPQHTHTHTHTHTTPHTPPHLFCCSAPSSASCLSLTRRCRCWRSRRKLSDRPANA